MDQSLAHEREQQLLAANAQLHALFDAMAEGVVIQDVTGAVISANAAAERILRTPRAALLESNAHGPTLVPLVRRDGSPMPDSERPAARALHAGETIKDCVMGLQMPDGKTTWISTNATPLRVGDEQRITGVVLTIRDITEQVVLESALQGSLGDLNKLVATLPVGIAVSHGPTMRYVNDALVRMLGYDERSELEGRTTLDIIHPNSEKAIRERYAAMGSGQHPGPGVLECRRKDGGAVVVEVTSMPSVYENQPAILAIVRDLTESVRAREAQERSELRFRTLLNFAPVGIFETNLAGQCVYANQRAASLCGLTQAEMLGQGWTKAVHPDDLEGILAKRIEARNAGTGLLHDLRFVRQDRVVFAQVQSIPLVSEGAVTGYLGSLVDLTELRTAHGALVESLAQKETLLKEVHHRVKNNLQVIASLLRLGRRYVGDASALSIFDDSIARIHSIALIHERLYQSRDLDHIDISQYLEGLTQELIRANATRHRVATAVLAARSFFNIDHCVPIGLIVNELVSNALKHAFVSDPPRPPVVTVGLKEVPLGYELTVRDNGVGMPENQPHDGSLGLRIVSSLAKQLGGDARVESENGTAWYVTFPRADGAEAAR